MSDVSKIVGLIPSNIQVIEDEHIIMNFTNGAVAEFFHNQVCCEYVDIEDVNGDWDDLIGNPILVAEERTNDDHDTPTEGLVGRDDSNTWTFYTFRGIKGSVDVRWHGSSNGYYSESVDFTFTGKTASEQLNIQALPDLYEACAEFVRKVESGRARSTASYNQMKLAMQKAETHDD